jgi:hypothetical protein
LGILRSPQPRSERISSHPYRGFAITSRTYQVRGTGQWAIGIVIGRWGSKRAFDTTFTAPSEEAANEMCWSLGRRIIDQSQNVTSLADLVGEPRDA